MTTRTKISTLIRLALPTLALLMPGLAAATCTRQDGNGNAVRPTSSTWSGTFIPRNSGTVGTRMAYTEFTGAAVSTGICAVNANADWSGGYKLPAGWSWDAANNWLQTNLRGVAFRMTAKGAKLTGGVERPLQFTYRRRMTAADGRLVPGYPNLVQVFDDQVYLLELVWSEPTIEFGQLSNGDFAYFYTDNVTNAPYRVFTMSGMTIVAPSCDINASDLKQSVDLGRHSASDLMAGPSAWTDFSFTSESCDATRFTNARFTFSAPAVSGTDLFEVKGGATGIGLALEAMPASGAVTVKPNTAVSVLPLSTGSRYLFRARLQALAGQQPSAGTINTPVQVTVDFM